MECCRKFCWRFFQNEWYAGKKKLVVVFGIEDILLASHTSHPFLQSRSGTETKILMKFHTDFSKQESQYQQFFWIFPEEFADLFVLLQDKNIQIGFYSHDVYDREDFIDKLNDKMLACRKDFIPLDVHKTTFVGVDEIIKKYKLLGKYVNRKAFGLKCYYEGEYIVYGKTYFESIKNLPSKFEVLDSLFGESMRLITLVDGQDFYDQDSNEFFPLNEGLRSKYINSFFSFCLIYYNIKLNINLLKDDETIKLLFVQMKENILQAVNLYDECDAVIEDGNTHKEDLHGEYVAIR